MLTTLEVRAIMKSHISTSYYNPIYTNKRAELFERSVKCYMPKPDVAERLIDELREKAGAENVKVTEGSNYAYSPGPGIIVRCLLA
jgi:hypothetical protein